MSRFLLDTSCMVAAVCTWHEHHGRALLGIERRLDEGHSMIIAGPALVESYAVLTRLPHPYRLAPHDAAALLTENFTDDEVEIVGLDGRTSAQLIGEAPYQHVVGGRIYDAVIAACAVLGGADTLLTFNRRHFETLAHPSIEVVVPA